jgi:hypothetical protein
MGASRLPPERPALPLDAVPASPRSARPKGVDGGIVSSWPPSSTTRWGIGPMRAGEVWEAMEVLRVQGKITYFAGWHIAKAQAAACARH